MYVYSSPFVAKMMKRPTRNEKMGLQAQKAKNPTKAAGSGAQPKSKPVRKPTAPVATEDGSDEEMEMDVAELAAAKQELKQQRLEQQRTAMDTDNVQPKKKKGGLKSKAKAAKAAQADEDDDAPKADYVDLYDRSMKMGKRHK